MLLTKEKVEALRTTGGGYKLSVLRWLGVGPTPPVGWVESLAAQNRSVSLVEYEALLTLKDERTREGKQ